MLNGRPGNGRLQVVGSKNGETEGGELASATLARLVLVARALTGAVEPLEVLEVIVKQGMAGLGAEGGVLAVVAEHEHRVVPVVTVGYSAAALSAFQTIAIDENVPLAVAAREARPVWVSSWPEAAIRFPDLVTRSRSGSQAWAAVPLTDAGRPIAVLGVSFLATRRFSPTDRLLVQALADLCTLALRNAMDHRERSSVCTEGAQPVLQAFATAALAMNAASAGLACPIELGDALQHARDKLDVAIRAMHREALAAHAAPPLSSAGAATVW